MEKSKTIHLEEPNTLASFLTEEERQNIVSLKITGLVGTKDFDGVLDDMCMCEGEYDDSDNFIPDYNESPAIRHLDMSEATFVDGETLPYFGWHTQLETFIFPQGIKYTFETGFTESDNLHTLILPDGMEEVRDFGNCLNLTGLVLPESLEEIHSFAFAGCDSITEIRIPPAVKAFDGSCFAGCKIAAYEVDEKNPYFTVIDGVVYSKDLTKLIAFPSAYPHKHFTVPNTVRTIGYSAFMDSPIKSIQLPDSLTVIEGWAFQNSAIHSIEMPDSVTEVGELAFRWCSELKHVRLSTRITKIPRQLFTSCLKLKNLDIPPSVKTIHYSAIAWNHGIERLILHDGLEEIVDDGPLLGCGGNLCEVNFPKTLKKVPGGVFNYSPNLKKFKLDPENPYFRIIDGALCSKDGRIIYAIPDVTRTNYVTPEGIEVIAARAFSYLPKLQEVILPSTLKTIEERAFQGCYNLKSLHIPAGVTKIGVDFLLSCEKLNEVIIDSAIPPELTGHVRDDVWLFKDMTLLVSQNAAGAYKAALGWKSFKVEESKN